MTVKECPECGSDVTSEMAICPKCDEVLIDDNTDEIEDDEEENEDETESE